MDIFDELKSLIGRLEEEKVDYALCGGLAMAVYALPRATLDIDIMMESGSMENAKQIVRELGFDLSAMAMEFQKGKVHLHRVYKVEPGTGETLVLDLLVVTSEIRKAWESRIKLEWEGGPLSVVSPEGLILLKSLRGSGQDWDDIKYLEGIKDEN